VCSRSPFLYGFGMHIYTDRWISCMHIYLITCNISILPPDQHSINYHLYSFIMSINTRFILYCTNLLFSAGQRRPFLCDSYQLVFFSPLCLAMRLYIVYVPTYRTKEKRSDELIPTCTAWSSCHSPYIPNLSLSIWTQPATQCHHRSTPGPPNHRMRTIVRASPMAWSVERPHHWKMRLHPRTSARLIVSGLSTET
jgi:hypothetical protein